MQPVVSDIRRVAEGAQKPSGHGTWTLKAQARSGTQTELAVAGLAVRCAKDAQPGLVVLKQFS